MRRDGKFTNHDIASIVADEGIGYAIQHYCNADSIVDPILAARWAEAKEALEAVEDILFPDGLEAWEETDHSDSDDEEDE